MRASLRFLAQGRNLADSENLPSPDVIAQEIVEDLEAALDYPSRLLLGWRGDRPLHVVCAYNSQDDEQIVITVYEPDPALWVDGFRRRRQ